MAEKNVHNYRTEQFSIKVFKNKKTFFIFKDGTWHWEEGGIKKEEDRMDEEYMDQSAVSESQTRIKSRHAIPER